MCNETWPPLLPPWKLIHELPHFKTSHPSVLRRAVMILQCSFCCCNQLPLSSPTQTKLKIQNVWERYRILAHVLPLCLNCLLKEKLPLLYSNLLISVYRFRVAWWCSPAIDIAWAKETRRDWSSWHFVCLCACLDCGQKMTWLHISLWTLMSLMHWCVSRSRTTRTPTRKWMNV